MRKSYDRSLQGIVEYCNDAMTLIGNDLREKKNKKMGEFGTTWDEKNYSPEFNNYNLFIQFKKDNSLQGINKETPTSNDFAIVQANLARIRSALGESFTRNTRKPPSPLQSLHLDQEEALEALEALRFPRKNKNSQPSNKNKDGQPNNEKPTYSKGRVFAGTMAMAFGASLITLSQLNLHSALPVLNTLLTVLAAHPVGMTVAGSLIAAAGLFVFCKGLPAHQERQESQKTSDNDNP